MRALSVRTISALHHGTATGSEVNDLALVGVSLVKHDQLARVGVVAATGVHASSYRIANTADGDLIIRILWSFEEGGGQGGNRERGEEKGETKRKKGNLNDLC